MSNMSVERTVYGVRSTSRYGISEVWCGRR
jgi:hypothetical protein